MKKQIIFDFYNTLFNPKTGKLFSGTLSLLKQLNSQYCLTLITTFSSTRLEEIQNMKIANLFKIIIVCDEKIETVYKQSSLLSLKTIIIGDRAKEEITIGNKLKLTCLQVNPKLENPCKTIRQAWLRRLI